MRWAFRIADVADELAATRRREQIHGAARAGGIQTEGEVTGAGPRVWVSPHSLVQYPGRAPDGEEHGGAIRLDFRQATTTFSFRCLVFRHCADHVMGRICGPS